MPTLSGMTSTLSSLRGGYASLMTVWCETVNLGDTVEGLDLGDIGAISRGIGNDMIFSM